ncbi:MAG TPA: hypothetical protein PKI41_11920, partial [Candidatus Competibacteraceae bacterium]|nr:hypothetical protein [Candidatus Competibacteraceae bacterium]
MSLSLGSLSLSALTVAARGTVPVVVGVKVNAQLNSPPVASELTPVGQVLLLVLLGKTPVKLQLALIAAVVALLVHVSVQITRLPTA